MNVNTSAMVLKNMKLIKGALRFRKITGVISFLTLVVPLFLIGTDLIRLKSR